MAEKIVLAYSGGLDTSVAIRWLKEDRGYDVVAVGPVAVDDASQAAKQWAEVGRLVGWLVAEGRCQREQRKGTFDAIATEVERVSENQRSTTRLLSEGKAGHQA